MGRSPRAVPAHEQVDVAHVVRLQDHDHVGRRRGEPVPHRALDGGGARGSSSTVTPRDSTANDATSGSQSVPSLQPGWGWRHSHSPGANVS